jgi:trypsin-like peptidase
MTRALLVAAAILAVVPRFAGGQALSVLHIKIVLVDADKKPTPVPHYALLISDNPSSAPPRRVVTALDGTADVRLRPGNYTVESDVPLAFEGKAYEWVRTLDVVAGRDTVLELTAVNAEIGTIGADAASIPSPATDPSSLLVQWQQSVIALWTPTTHAAGFVADASGIVVTSQRVVGGATSIEVEMTPTVKVAGKILAADATRDVAVVWIDAATAAAVKSIPLGCAAPAKAEAGQKIVSIDAPFRQPKSTTAGTISRVTDHEIESDIFLTSGSAGGPVFGEAGVVGLTSAVDDNSSRRRGSARIVRVSDVCEVVAAAQQKMKDTGPPSAAHLPTEPERPFPTDALRQMVERRAGSLNPYQIASAEFDIAFITPVHVYGAQSRADQMRRRERTGGGAPSNMESMVVRAATDFGDWSEYVADAPPVLLVHATPKMVEGFWTKVARGAAQTQGVAIPAMKHFAAGFVRMRAFCGDAEITPIHPFTIERRVSDTDVVDEGLYIFDADALGPQCGSVKLTLYSAKTPEKADTQNVDMKIVEQFWRDFAPYRDAK